MSLFAVNPRRKAGAWCSTSTNNKLDDGLAAETAQHTPNPEIRALIRGTSLLADSRRCPHCACHTTIRWLLPPCLPWLLPPATARSASSNTAPSPAFLLYSHNSSRRTMAAADMYTRGQPGETDNRGESLVRGLRLLLLLLLFQPASAAPQAVPSTTASCNCSSSFLMWLLWTRVCRCKSTWTSCSSRRRQQPWRSCGS